MDYERALNTLKDLLPQDAIAEFAILEVRMKENIHDERLYGSTQDTRAARFTIVGALNQLAIRYITTTFTDLCYPQESSARAKPPQNVPKRDTPEVLIRVLTKVIPTAYYHLLNTQDYPFLLVTINNTDPNGDDAPAILAIQAYIEGYSDVAKTTVEIKKGEQKKVTLLPVLKYAEIRNIHDLQKATLHIDIRQLASHRAEISSTTEQIYLTSRNQALIAQERETSTVDLTKYLTAWVTPNHPEISHVLRSACNHHPERELRGYQDGETIEETAASVREQVRAIFSTLKYDRKLAYTHSTLGWEIQPGWISQKVRLPGDCLREGGVANCLDGAVLFASLLEACGIEPLLVLVPGHAFVGWRVKPSMEQYEFLETTMMKQDFDQAQEYATTLFVHAQKNQAFQRELYHPRGFARLINVHDSRIQGIYPLE